MMIAEHKVTDINATADGISLHTSAIRRPPPETLDQRWNCHSKIHEVAALVEALEAGDDEALMLDVNGNVATCNSTNFFIVTDGEVWTSTGEHCLNGITRHLVIELAQAEGITTRMMDFTLADVYSADEAFVTGTYGGITPVAAVDGRRIGERVPGPVTANLSAARTAAFDSAATQ